MPSQKASPRSTSFLKALRRQSELPQFQSSLEGVWTIRGGTGGRHGGVWSMEDLLHWEDEDRMGVVS